MKGRAVGGDKDNKKGGLTRKWRGLMNRLSLAKARRSKEEK